MEFDNTIKDDYDLFKVHAVDTGVGVYAIPSYKVPYNGSYKGSVKMNMTTYFGTYSEVNINIYKANSGVVTLLTTQNYVFLGETVNQLDFEQTLAKDDYIYIQLEMVAGVSLILPNSSLSIFEITLDDIVYGNAFPVAVNLPDMTCKEFIKTFMQETGQIIQYDSWTNTLYFKSFKQLIDNKINSYDWSDKLASMSTSFKLGNYAQKNYLMWAEDMNVNENKGRGSFSVNDKKLDFSKDLFTLPFAATNSASKLIGKDVSKIPVYKTDDGSIQKQNDYKERLLLMRTQSFACTFNDGVETPVVISNNLQLPYFNYNGDGLGFEYLIPEYYGELTDMLKQAKVVKAIIDLNANDVATIDLFKPVYLKQTGQYYYINKISQFIEGVLTDVELIKM